jgi:hypothetical protein
MRVSQLVRRTFLLLVGVAVASGCATRPLAPWDLSKPGWTVQEVPAVWRPSSQAPELTGELMLACSADGSRLVQFSKQGVPLVTAREDGIGWELRSALRRGTYSGRGKGPSRLVWFQVDGFPPATVDGTRWNRTLTTPGGWVLEDLRGGERLEAAAP